MWKKAWLILFKLEGKRGGSDEWRGEGNEKEGERRERLAESLNPGQPFYKDGTVDSSGQGG